MDTQKVPPAMKGHYSTRVPNAEKIAAIAKKMDRAISQRDENGSPIS